MLCVFHQKSAGNLLMRLIDTHCHWDDSSFEPDRIQLVQRMQALGVTDLIVPAIAARTWPQLSAVCGAEGLHACYGLHPIYLAEHRSEHLLELEHYVQHHPTVAIGECGLDFFLPELDVTRQIELFLAQLRLAKRLDLPVVVHARRSVDQVIKYLRQVGGLRGVIHSFAGSQQQADTLIALGFYLGIGGTVTYERAQRLRRVVATLPEACILLETDAPDQPDSQWRGQRNEPSRLPVIAAAVAELRGVSVATLAASTTANALRLFGIR